MARKKRALHTAPLAEAELGIWDTALYGRLSVLDNGKADGDPIESQVALMEQYVSEHPELRIVERFLDNGYTGTNYDRPRFQAMMRAVKAGKINCIIVKDLSRLGRNYIETGNFLERICPKLGVRFISINDHYDTAALQSQDELAVSLKNIVNDYYAKEISQKAGAALKAKRLNGEYIGSYAPHGYLKDPENKNHLIIDPVTAPVIRQIYQWRAQGLGYGTITRLLNERDIPSPGRYRFEHGIITNNNKKGSALLWNRHALSDILRNIAYIGHLAQGKCSASLIRGIPVHRTKESEWDVSYHTHEPIISEELFYQVQALNQERADTYRSNYGACSHLPKRKNPYGKKLICADCGAQMKLYRNLSRDRKKAYFTYLCPTYEEHRELRCTKKSIRSDDLDAAVLQALRVQMDLFCDAHKVLNALAGRELSRPEHTVELELQRIEQEIKRKQGYAMALYEDYKAGILTKEECAIARSKYQADVERLKEQAALLRGESNLHTQVIEKANGWAERFEQYRHAEVISADLVAAFFKEIRVSADGSIHVTFLFEDELRLIQEQNQALQTEVA